ncbi:MAG: S-methyl-5'-thioinosine phosphorylase [Wenzhouxiangella sp.]|nr:MAG: S-methyl-5'-thioinosine phosphorylase [Wenzhouxiangella sp.]
MLGVIGGTGALDLFESGASGNSTTRWGQASAAPVQIDLGAMKAWFLARHGRPHRIPPHRIDYRANIAALKALGVRHIIALNAVGAVSPELEAGALVLPDQLIDYTWGRVHTFSDDAQAPLEHIEFADPFAGPTRSGLLAAASAADVDLLEGGCYGVTQGPRLETAAEVARLAADGCTLVGMTAMPEAALAREAGLDYASLCVVANPGAGLEDEPISIDEIHRVLQRAMQRVVALLQRFSPESLA